MIHRETLLTRDGRNWARPVREFRVACACRGRPHKGPEANEARFADEFVLCMLYSFIGLEVISPFSRGCTRR